MNKGKIVTIIGATLLTVGVIGGVCSGIVAMPTVINNIVNSQNILNKEDVLYKGQANLTKLNINAKVSNVTIRKYDGQNVIVERSGDKSISTITAKENTNELNITEEVINPNFGKSIDDMVRYFVNELYSGQHSNITVYVPNNIDVNISTDTGRLNVYDSNINNLNFNTSIGSIALNENCHINNLNIKSDDFIQLQVRELYRVKNLNVECYSIDIYEQDTVSDKSSIPENVNIVANGDYDDIVVDIDSNLPIAKNLEITSNGNVGLNLPILDYKFNFDVKASNGIYFDEESKVKYMGTYVDKYLDGSYRFDKNEFKGLINENPKDNSSEYFVNIRSANVSFK